jgi:hypothetical protein
VRKRTRHSVESLDPDSHVLAHPSFREIPKCMFPLASRKAKDEYNRLALLLFNAGHLTALKHRALSSYAMQYESINKSIDEGKTLSTFAFNVLDKLLRKLGLDELDKPIASPETAPKNKFSKCGFSARRREPV